MVCWHRCCFVFATGRIKFYFTWALLCKRPVSSKERQDAHWHRLRNGYCSKRENNGNMFLLLECYLYGGDENYINGDN